MATCGAAAASDRQPEQTELIDLAAPDGSLTSAGCDVQIQVDGDVAWASSCGSQGSVSRETGGPHGL